MERESANDHGVNKTPEHTRTGPARGPSDLVPRAISGVVSTTTGWRPTCAHDAEPVPCVVLDPFAGSGTLGKVANRLSRRAVLIELNPEYIEQVEERTMQTPLGLSGVA